MTDQPAGKPVCDNIKINRNNNNVHCPQYKGVNTRTIAIKNSKDIFWKKILSIFSTNAARNTTQAKKKKIATDFVQGNG